MVGDISVALSLSDRFTLFDMLENDFDFLIPFINL